MSVYDNIADDYTRECSYGVHLAADSLQEFTTFLPHNGRLLDIGCGGGQDTKFLSDKGFTLDAIDVSTAMISLAKQHYPGENFFVDDVMNLKEKEKYDGIWCCRVFQHVSLSDQDSFLNHLLSLLKKDGILYITVAVSNEAVDTEANDSGNDNLLKKKQREKSFKNLFIDRNCTILSFDYWKNHTGMEIFVRK